MRIGSVTGTRVARRMVSTRRHGAHRRDEAHDAVGRHGERVAAADDDVAHLGVRPEPRERRRERLERRPRRRRSPTMRERVQKRQ